MNKMLPIAVTFFLAASPAIAFAQGGGGGGAGGASSGAAGASGGSTGTGGAAAGTGTGSTGGQQAQMRATVAVRLAARQAPLRGPQIRVRPPIRVQY
jgi:hypothetical protein